MSTIIVHRYIDLSPEIPATTREMAPMLTIVFYKMASLHSSSSYYDHSANPRNSRIITVAKCRRFLRCADNLKVQRTDFWMR